MEYINLDAIIDNIPHVNTSNPLFHRDRARALMIEAINQALVLAGEKAGLTRCFPLEGTENSPVKEEKDIEDNYEANYKSPYQEDSGATIWINKQSILDVKKLVI